VKEESVKEKTVTMVELRRRVGAISYAIRERGETFVLTYQGRPFARLGPLDDATTIAADGTVRGPLPLTHRRPELIGR
jgi:antitoxin (DNA-binding transcriptional repressor) of toxin-antitoxin stability system